MKKTFYIFILISFSRQILGQTNLVTNPSFENYSSCPNSTNQVSLSIGWSNPTTSGTPDYYNACSTSANVPYCFGGFQYAKSGNAHSGIYGYSKAVTNVREYVQSQLTTTLVLNKCYYIGFYLNQANWTGVGCNNMGAYLSSNAISLSGPTYLLNYTSQIKGFGNKVVIDTLNWHLISGIFQSSGNEQYITIGNFNNDVSTDTLTYNSAAASPSSYYYIDDVYVIPIDSIPGGMPAFAGNNVSINVGDSAFIGQQISNLNCTWYNGTVQIASNISGIYVQPTVTTTYVVQQNLCGNITNDTVVVTVNPFGTGINSTQIKNSMVLISPNPNSGLINLEILNKDIILQNSTIKIYDLFSREIKKFKLINKKQELELTDLKNGIYYLQFFLDDKLLLTKKIIKQ